MTPRKHMNKYLTPTQSRDNPQNLCMFMCYFSFPEFCTYTWHVPPKHKPKLFLTPSSNLFSGSRVAIAPTCYRAPKPQKCILKPKSATLDPPKYGPKSLWKCPQTPFLRRQNPGASLGKQLLEPRFEWLEVAWSDLKWLKSGLKVA